MACIMLKKLPPIPSLLFVWSNKTILVIGGSNDCTTIVNIINATELYAEKWETLCST